MSGACTPSNLTRLIKIARDSNGFRPDPEHPTLVLGCPVMAQYFATKVGGQLATKWMQGNIVFIHGGGRFDVYYADDGDLEEQVSSEYIKVMPSVEPEAPAAKPPSKELAALQASLVGKVALPSKRTRSSISR